MVWGTPAAIAGSDIHDSKALDYSLCLSSSRLHSKKTGNFRVTTANDQTSLRQSLQADAAPGASVEKSYQSKTTIRRTEQGGYAFEYEISPINNVHNVPIDF